MKKETRGRKVLPEKEKKVTLRVSVKRKNLKEAKEEIKKIFKKWN